MSVYIMRNISLVFAITWRTRGVFIYVGVFEQLNGCNWGISKTVEERPEARKKRDEQNRRAAIGCVWFTHIPRHRASPSKIFKTARFWVVEKRRFWTEGGFWFLTIFYGGGFFSECLYPSFLVRLSVCVSVCLLRSILSRSRFFVPSVSCD